MNPIRVEETGVEPVSLAEMRLYLRLDSDETAEDGLIGSLITAARVCVETQSRRLLRPARFRVMLPCWPMDGILPLPLSPLVALAQASLVAADGTLEPIDPVLLSIGPDPWEAPCLRIEAAVPPLLRRSALIEVVAGCGGEGPSPPGPLVQAIRMSVADWFENRGERAPVMPAPAMALIARHRPMRL